MQSHHRFRALSTRAALLLGLCLPAAVAAQEPPASIVVPRADQSPEVDGRLDEAAWDGAAVFEDWVQTSPGDNVAPAGRTRAYLVHDDAALYIGIRARDPAGIRYAVHPRDQVTQQGQDWFGVLLDTFDDRRQAFGFAVNPVGVQGDGIQVEGGGQIEWDAIFQTAGRVEENGTELAIEMRIPFNSLRFRRGAAQTWGFSLNRVYGRTGASDSPWPLDRDLNCTLCQLGSITLEGIQAGRNLEINPALVANMESARPVPGSPLAPFESAFEPGLNLKYGITSNLTLDATLNPDFSQIESDAGQLEVNNRFALFFPEKRPFFLEGADIFSTGIQPPGSSPFVRTPIDLFHSRTIIDPDWGAKLSGKVGPMGLGAIVARDAATPLDVGSDLSDPGAGMAVGRATLDVLSDGYVGGVFTGRGLSGARDLLGGVDTRMRFGDHVVVQGLAATSQYESPTIDGQEPARSGTALQAQVDWGSRHWTGGVTLVDITPDFVAPMGFIPRTDQIMATGSMGYIWQGTGWIQRVSPRLRYERIYDHGTGGGVLDAGRLVDVLWEPIIGFELARSTSIGMGYHRAYTYFDGQAFPDQDRFGFDASSQAIDWLRLSGGALWGETVIFSDHVEDGRASPGWTIEGSLTATLRPIPAVRVELGFQGSRVWRRTPEEARGSRFANALIPRIRAEYQVTRRLGLRTILEWRNTRFYEVAGPAAEASERLSVEFLASYILNAGSALYLGWTELQGGDLTDPLAPARRGGVAKASYVWRF